MSIIHISSFIGEDIADKLFKYAKLKKCNIIQSSDCERFKSYIIHHGEYIELSEILGPIFDKLLTEIKEEEK